MSVYKISITTRDRLLLAWQHTMALVRDLGAYAEEEGAKSEVGRLFLAAAEEQGKEAARFLDELRRLENV